MRRFADTLPTLRDTAGTAPPQAGFEADAILKILRTGSRAGAAGGEARDIPPAGDPGHGTQAGPAGHLWTNPGQTAPTRDRPDRSAVAGHPRSVQHAIPPIDSGAGGNADPSAEEAKAAARARIDEEIAAAVARTRAEVEGAAAVHLENERMRWAQELAAALSTQLDQAFEALQERIAAAAAAALAPVLEEAMTQKAVGQFSERLDRLLARESPARAVVVRGPPPLIEALGNLRSGKTPSVQLVESAETELTVRINDTSLRTTIGMWAGTLTNSSGRNHGTK